MMVKIMSDSKKIKGKVHFYVSRLAGAVHFSLHNFVPPKVIRLS